MTQTFQNTNTQINNVHTAMGAIRPEINNMWDRIAEIENNTTEVRRVQNAQEILLDRRLTQLERGINGFGNTINNLFQEKNRRLGTMDDAIVLLQRVDGRIDKAHGPPTHHIIPETPRPKSPYIPCFEPPLP